MPTPNDSTIGAGRRSVETVTKEVNALATLANNTQAWFTGDGNSAFGKARDALTSFIPEFLESYGKWSHELDNLEGLQEEAAALQSRIDGDELQEKKLKATIEATKEELASAQNDVQEQIRKRNEAMKEAEASQDKTIRNEAFISERKGALEDEEAQLRTAQGEVKRKTIALEAKEETLNGLRDRSQELQDRCKVREDDLTTAATKLALACDIHLDYEQLRAQPEYVQSLVETLVSFVKGTVAKLEESVHQHKQLQEDSNRSKRGFEDQLTKANRDLTTAQSRCETLENKIKEVEASQTEAEREKDAAGKELDIKLTKANDDLAEAQGQCATLEKRVEELKVSQAKAEQEKDEARKELQSEKIAHGEQKVVNDGLRGHYDRLAPFEQQLTDSKVALGRSQAKLEFETQRTDKLKEEVEKLKEMRGHSDQQILLQAMTIEERENQAAQLQVMTESLRTEQSRVQRGQEEIERKKLALTASIITQKDLEQQIAGFEVAIAKADAESKDLNDKYTLNLQDLNDIRKSSLQQSKELAVSEGKNTRIQRELDEEKTKLTETSQQRDAEVQRSQTLENERDTLARQYHDSTTQLNRVKEELAKLKKTLQQTRAEKDEMELDVTERNNERHAMAQLKLDHTILRDTKNAREDSLQNLKNEMATKLAEVKTLMGDKADLVKERNRLSTDLETTKEKTQGQKDEIAYLNEELERERDDSITRLEYETTRLTKQSEEDRAGLTKKLEKENARITRHLEEEIARIKRHLEEENARIRSHLEEEIATRVRERRQWERAEASLNLTIQSRNEEIEALCDRRQQQRTVTDESIHEHLDLSDSYNKLLIEKTKLKIAKEKLEEENRRLSGRLNRPSLSKTGVDARSEHRENEIIALPSGTSRTQRKGTIIGHDVEDEDEVEDFFDRGPTPEPSSRARVQNSRRTGSEVLGTDEESDVPGDQQPGRTRSISRTHRKRRPSPHNIDSRPSKMTAAANTPAIRKTTTAQTADSRGRRSAAHRIDTSMDRRSRTPGRTVVRDSDTSPAVDDDPMELNVGDFTFKVTRSVDGKTRFDKNLWIRNLPAEIRDQIPKHFKRFDEKPYQPQWTKMKTTDCLWQKTGNSATVFRRVAEGQHDREHSCMNCEKVRRLCMTLAAPETIKLLPRRLNDEERRANIGPRDVAFWIVPRV